MTSWSSSYSPRPGSGLSRAACTRRTALGTLMGILPVAACAREKDLPVYWQAPQFALLDQEGKTFSSRDVGTRVVVANFIYTNCTDICPALSATMRRIQDRLRREQLLGTKVLLLSFSVDPARDTPPVLREYAQRFSADPASWKFLTGDPVYVQQVVVQGFKLGVQPSTQIIHSDRFALIDGRGSIRALPDGATLNVDQLVRDVRRLALSGT
ncbi:MAG: photosynthetic protein synthase I [Chloroflexota bacterium]